jgi:Protein of unknown function (DUF2800).
MIFNTHSALAGRHAFLSASKYHWTNYDDDKLEQTFRNAVLAQKGSELHDIAASLIRNGIKLPDVPKTFNQYVNDAIGFRMEPEQVLHYSDNAFGTADAISFRQDVLRIHDLKTGTSPTSIRQLEIYAAFFCLEYGFKPANLQIEMAIYQNDEVVPKTADPTDITTIMSRIITFDKRIDDLRMEALL